MSTIAVTARTIALAFPTGFNDVRSGISVEALTGGQVVYQTTAGVFGLCDTGEAAKDEPRGICLEEAVAAGQVFSYVVKGAIYGVTLSGEAYDGLVYASNTAGGMSDSAVAEIIGRVIALADKDKTKILYVDIRGGAGGADHN